MSSTYSKEPVYPSRVGAIPTKERCRQNGGVVAEIIPLDGDGKNTVERYRAVYECPLDAYRDHKVINAAEYRAGLIFHRAYFWAVLCQQAVHDRQSPKTTGIKLTRSEIVLREAYRTLSPHTKGVIIDICGHGHPTRDKFRLDALQKGLGQLSGLWKTAAEEVCGN